MLVNIIKFIHLVCVLGLLGSVAYCFTLIGSKKFTRNHPRLFKTILYLSLTLLITGTILVYPKHFSFHTPWIKAAYIFLLTFCLGIIFVNQHVVKNGAISKSTLIKCTYAMLTIILLCIMHDAITKSTFLF